MAALVAGTGGTVLRPGVCAPPLPRTRHYVGPRADASRSTSDGAPAVQGDSSSAWFTRRFSCIVRSRRPDPVRCGRKCVLRIHSPGRCRRAEECTMKRMLINVRRSPRNDARNCRRPEADGLSRPRSKAANSARATSTRPSRVEPSLEACLSTTAEDRHGFLPFKEISKRTFREGASVRRAKIQTSPTGPGADGPG